MDVFEVTEDHAGGLQQSRSRLAVCRHNDSDHSGPLVFVTWCVVAHEEPHNSQIVTRILCVLWGFSGYAYFRFG